jgi:hypothetical protein
MRLRELKQADVEAKIRSLIYASQNDNGAVASGDDDSCAGEGVTFNREC